MHNYQNYQKYKSKYLDLKYGGALFTLNPKIEHFIVERKFRVDAEYGTRGVADHHKKAIMKMLNDPEIDVKFSNFGYIDDEDRTIKYNLILISNDYFKYDFVQLTEKGISFLRFKLPKYTKKIAIEDIITKYSGKDIKIPKGKFYYYDNHDNKIVIGWHGSFSPPRGMGDDDFLIPQDIIDSTAVS
jgi:hypothetical protein